MFRHSIRRDECGHLEGSYKNAVSRSGAPSKVSRFAFRIGNDVQVPTLTFSAQVADRKLSFINNRVDTCVLQANNILQSIV